MEYIIYDEASEMDWQRIADSIGPWPVDAIDYTTLQQRIEALDAEVASLHSAMVQALERIKKLEDAGERARP